MRKALLQASLHLAYSTSLGTAWLRPSPYSSSGSLTCRGSGSRPRSGLASCQQVSIPWRSASRLSRASWWVWLSWPWLLFSFDFLATALIDLAIALVVILVSPTGMSLVSVLRHTHEAIRLGMDQAKVERMRTESPYILRIFAFAPFSYLGITKTLCLLDLRPVEFRSFCWANACPNQTTTKHKGSQN